MATQDFDRWYKRVDAIVSGIAGIGVDDLPDCCYGDMFEDMYTPKEAAKEALLAADFPPELL